METDRCHSEGTKENVYVEEGVGLLEPDYAEIRDTCAHDDVNLKEKMKVMDSDASRVVHSKPLIPTAPIMEDSIGEVSEISMSSEGSRDICSQHRNIADSLHNMLESRDPLDMDIHQKDDESRDKPEMRHVDSVASVDSGNDISNMSNCAVQELSYSPSFKDDLQYIDLRMDVNNEFLDNRNQDNVDNRCQDNTVGSKQEPGGDISLSRDQTECSNCESTCRPYENEDCLGKHTTCVEKDHVTHIETVNGYEMIDVTKRDSPSTYEALNTTSPNH